ncbi:hypothetical protein Patl1_16146 [Pistacia atlantica]|uniref:Uncharacterized protein n=1 Tax=Pistacia atlantica TaxID=434234 RepID=A0ACC1B5B6_9ROSI|nr:hypothetical protein Patl1_16146 [Pistacia atlantica]
MAWLPASTELRTLRKISNSNIFTTQKLDANQHLRRHKKVVQLISYVQESCDARFRRIKGPCAQFCAQLRFFNEYLPEDKDPLHAWLVICFVSVLALVVSFCYHIILCQVKRMRLCVTIESNTSATPLIKKVFLHSASADRILLPDGRYMAYRVPGVPVDRARFSIIVPHTNTWTYDFTSGRVWYRLLTYDIPWFWKSSELRKNIQMMILKCCPLVVLVRVACLFFAAARVAF